MTDPDAIGDRPLSLVECPVCSRLGDVEQSYAKWGWDEQTIAFPHTAQHLVMVEDDALGGDAAATGTALVRCPECGTLYRYTWSSEYYVNGSEERSELRRLAPAQARGALDDVTYDWLMSWMGLWLSHAEAAVRRHAARSLAAHHLAAGRPDTVRTLLTSVDPEVARGAVFLLRDAVRDHDWDIVLSPLSDALQVLARDADGEIAGAATYLLRRVGVAGSPTY